jgi:hypothetical protein
MYNSINSNIVTTNNMNTNNNTITNNPTNSMNNNTNNSMNNITTTTPEISHIKITQEGEDEDQVEAAEERRDGEGCQEEDEAILHDNQ